jgi:glutathione peroxidase
MTYALLIGLVFFGLAIFSTATSRESNILGFKVKNIDGKEVEMSKYKGKVLLIVNVASECGYTSQYEGLQKVYQNFNKQGLEVLGFPCNQFGGQEPGTEAEIQKFCSSKYSVTFPMFAKVDVNGDKAIPLFKYLTSNTDGFITDDIKWNFTKFLIGKDGKVIERYGSNTKPESIAKDIEKELGK